MSSCATPTAERVLWQADIARRLNVDRVTIYRWEIEGKLPAPDVVIGRRRGRYESTMLAWEAASAGRSAA